MVGILCLKNCIRSVSMEKGKEMQKSVSALQGLAIVVGMIIGLSGLGNVMPPLVYGVLDSASACMAPVSMLLVGIVLAILVHCNVIKLGE